MAADEAVVVVGLEVVEVLVGFESVELVGTSLGWGVRGGC